MRSPAGRSPLSDPSDPVVPKLVRDSPERYSELRRQLINVVFVQRRAGHSRTQRRRRGMEEASTVGKVLVTRVEAAAALARAVRERRIDQCQAHEAEREFLDDWGDFARIGVTDALTARAEGLAWHCDLRGLDLVVGCSRLGFQLTGKSG